MDAMDALPVNAINALAELVILPRDLWDGEAEVIDSHMIDALTQAGFRLRQCSGVEEVLAAVEGAGKQMIVVDAIGDDDADGCTLVSTLRARFQGGIVLFVRSSSQARERGLNAGADVVLSTSNRPSEAIAYLYALRRRILAMALPSASALQKNGNTGIENTWVLEQDGWSLRAPSGIAVSLNRSERTFLINLFEDCENLLRRDRWPDMQGTLPRSHYHGSSYRSIDVLVSRLRRKIDATGIKFPLHSKHRIGYQFVGKCFVDYARKA
jgi:two-component system OmpR family response regulator